MGSILNFVVPYINNKDENPPRPFMNGPATCEIFNKFNYTYEFKLQDGYYNIILIETIEKFKEARNILRDGFGGINIVEFVKNNNIKLLIASIADPATDDEKLNIIADIEKYGLTNDTYFLESNFRHKNDYNTLCWHFFLEDACDNIKQIYNGTQNQLGYVSEEITELELDSFRSKKFLSFNRTIDRKHRISLLHDYINSDFSDSYFSFISYESTFETTFQDYENDFNHLYYKKFIPIELDTHLIKDKSNFKTGDALKKDLFLNSCIHIVTETTFVDNEIFISEKILKPILGFQPFIVIGPYGYIKELKKYGFKTFSDFWDESYDEIENPKERYNKIMDTVFKLNSKSIKELNKLYQKTKDICIYNKNNFYKLKPNFNQIIKNIENEW